MSLNLRNAVFEIIIIILINICYIHTLFFSLENYFEKLRIYKFINFDKLDKLQLYIFFAYVTVMIQIVHIRSFIFILLIFSLILLIWFKTKFRIKYFVNFIFIFCSITALFNLVMKFIFYIFNISQVILIKNIENVICLFFIFKIIIYCIFKFLKSNLKYLNIKKIYPILTCFILVFVVISIIVGYSFLKNYNIIMNVIIFLCNVNLVVMLNFIIIIINLTSMQKIVKSVNLDTEYYNNVFIKLRSYIDNTRKLNHDFKNHVIVMSSLIEDRKYNDLDLYLKKLNAEESINVMNLVFSGNYVINAIINNKLSNAANLNIKIDTNIYVPHKLNLDNFDLTVVLCNLLDNAIEAVSRLKEEDRFIYIFI